MHRLWIAALAVVLALTGLVPLRAEEAARRRNGGYLGLFLREADGAITIERVHPGSKAEEVGFKPGDVVKAVNGRALPNGDALIRRLWSGRPLKFELKRGDGTVTVETTTKELDALPKEGDEAPSFSLPTKDGLGVLALSDLLAQQKPVVLVFGSFT